MTDLFDKCKEFTAAKEIQELGCYPYFHQVESGQDPVVSIEGKKMIMMGSNNYLGLTSHSTLKKAANNATTKYGVGCVGSRFLNGTLDMHVDLEERLAGFVNKESSLLFTTGMQTNLGVISALVGRKDVVITDKYDHASIIDGCRLSYGQLERYRHNDMDELKDILEKHGKDTGKLIVVDGVFSMEGDLADLPNIVPLAKEYNARILVDDAHGIGVMGENGRGTAEHFGLEDEIDLIVGTFSKAFASTGGFVAGDEDIIHFLKHNARSLIFSASPSPANVASVKEALKIVKKKSIRREDLWENTRRLREGFEKLGFNTGESVTPIIPLIVGDNEAAFKMWRGLFDNGIFTTPVVSPAVPENRALIRVSVMATFNQNHIDMALTVCGEVGKELGIIDGDVDIEVARSGPLTMGNKFKNWMKDLWRYRWK
ncbi:MAG: aminotransferase class I/II-fold pyridoxal phosphate-dependent enzyme [Elusimicrobiota bacterium]